MHEKWRKELFSVLELESKVDEKERRFLSSLRIRLNLSPKLKDLGNKKMVWEQLRINEKTSDESDPTYIKKISTPSATEYGG